MHKMQRRQNLQTQIEVKSNNNTGNAKSTYLQKQNVQLKEQNSQLAKELDEHKAIIKDLTRERDEAKQELIGEKAFTRKIMDCVKDIQHSAQINLSNLISSSNCVTDILKMTHTLDTFDKKDRRSIHTSLTENAAIGSSDILKRNLSNPNIVNENNLKNTSRFTSLNPLSFLLNLDPDNADDELPPPKNFRLSEFHKEDQHVDPGECSMQEYRNEIEKSIRLDAIAEESESTLASILAQPKEPSGRITENDSKLSRKDTSIQRRSNSLSEEDQIELIDDNEIITPQVTLLSSTIIASSPKPIAEFGKTKSFEKKESNSMLNETEVSKPHKSQSSFVSPEAIISDSLRLDSSNPTISKSEALMSYNLISVKNNISTTQVLSSPAASKKKVITKTKAKKAKRRKHLSELDQIIGSPTILRAIALRSFRKSRELRSKRSPKMEKRTFKEIWSESHTPKLLRPKTGSLKEPNLRNKLRR